MDLILGLLRQADVTPPWTTSILQFGAFGLLTYIVAHLAPSEMEKYRTESRRRDELFATVLAGIQSKADEKNEKMIAALDKQTEVLERFLTQHLATLLEALDHVCQYEKPKERKPRPNDERKTP